MRPGRRANRFEPAARPDRPTSSASLPRAGRQAIAPSTASNPTSPAISPHHTCSVIVSAWPDRTPLVRSSAWANSVPPRSKNSRPSANTPVESASTSRFGAPPSSVASTITCRNGISWAMRFKNSRCRPSGNTRGHRCESSCAAESRVVTGIGAPPPAGIR